MHNHLNIFPDYKILLYSKNFRGKKERKEVNKIHILSYPPRDN